MALILQQGVADQTARTVADAMSGVQFDMDPFKDSRDNLDEWLGTKPQPQNGGTGRPNPAHVFYYGDDHHDRYARNAGIDPTASNWKPLAKSQLGTPYVFGSTDCSGFTQWLVKRVTGKQLSHNAEAQAHELAPVGRDELVPGDLLFFAYTNDRGVYISHVEVYLGHDKMIGNANPTEDLDIDNVDWAHFVRGGRVPGMSGTISGGGGSKGGKVSAGTGRRSGGRRVPSSVGAPAPLTVPFATQPQNYFTSVLNSLSMTQPLAREQKVQALPNVKVGVGSTPADLQKVARQMVLQRGWSVSDFKDLVKLWSRESGWDPTAVNDSSGATGIPQLLPAAHDIPQNWSNPLVQIKWGLNYIAQRYGSPSAAWAHSEQTGWY